MTTAQHPIGSGFGAKSTADDVLAGCDLTGRRALVTGGYSGIGIEMDPDQARRLWALSAELTGVNVFG
jgi:hypothetical protein